MGLVQEHTKTGIRMGLGVLITCAVCYGILIPVLGPENVYSSAIFNAGKAASITTVVVNAPLMGRISQVGLDRSVGTVLGGCAGFGTVWLHYKFIHGPYEGSALLGNMLSLAACLAAYLSVEAGWRIAQLDTTPRLFTLTFLLVAFGTNGEDIKGDFVTLVSRISGILFGVVVSLLLAVVVFPKSATQESLKCMRNALEDLIDLSEAAWPKELQDGDSSRHKQDRQGVDYTTSSGRALKGYPTQLRVNKACEERLLKVFASLRRCIECGPLTKAEVYLGSIRGRLIFLPGLPLKFTVCGGWCLDLHSLEGLENSVSRVSRLIWALHLTFNEGISEHFAQILSQQYPRSLLPELQSSCQATLRDMVDAFTCKGKIVLTGNLTRFTRAVEGLLRISDYHRREQLQAVKLVRKLKNGSSARPNSVPEGDEAEGSEREEDDEDLSEEEAERQPLKGTDPEGCSPSHAFSDLPKGLDIRVRPPRYSNSSPRRSFRRTRSVEVQAGTDLDSGSTRLTVKHIDPEDLLYFPETVEGLVAQTKWSSFLFLTEELVEGLQDAHSNLTNLVATLPCDSIKV